MGGERRPIQPDSRRTALGLAAGLALLFLPAAVARAAPLPPTQAWVATFTRTCGGDDRWLAAATVSGTTFVVYRAHTWEFRLASFDPAGAPLADLLLENPGSVGITSMAFAPNGDLVLAGAIQNTTVDIWVGRYDATGAMLWASTDDSGFDDTSIAVVVDGLGNELVVSSYYDGIGSVGRLLALDSTGAIIAARSDPAIILSTNTAMVAVTTDPAGNVYAGGYADSGAFGDDDPAAVAYDGGGTQLWTQTYGIAAPPAYEYGRALTIAPNGDLYMGVDSLIPQAVGVLRLSTIDGSVIASGSKSDIAYNYLGGIAVDGAGGVYIAGMRTTTFTDFDPRLVAFSAGLAFQWSDVQAGGTYDAFGFPVGAARVATDANGLVYLSCSLIPDWSNFGQDFEVRQYSSAGAIQWTDRFDSAARADLVAAGTDGAGGVYQAGAFDNGPFVVKHSTAGAFQWANIPAMPTSTSSVYYDAEGFVLVSGTSFLETTATDAVTFTNNVEIIRTTAAGALLAPFRPSSQPESFNGPLTADAGGNLYASGWFRNPVSGNGNLWVSKLTPAGVVAWSLTYTLTVDDHPQGIALDLAGNVYLAETLDDGGDLYTGVIKVSPAGAVVWTRSFNAGPGLDEFAGDLKCDGTDLYLAGTINDSGSGDIWGAVRKVTAAGGLLWTRTYDGGGAEALFTGVALDPAFGAYAVGQAGPLGPAGDITPADTATVAYAADGTLRWAQTYDSGAAGDLGRAAAVGSAYAAGQVDNAIHLVKYTENAAALLAALSVTPATVAPGEWSLVVLTVSNTGTVNATGVLPFLEVNSGGAAGTILAGPVPPGPVTIGPGINQSFTWTVSANGLGTLGFTATGLGTDAGGGDLLVVARAGAVNVLPGATLEAALSVVAVSGTAYVGQWISVRLTVTNTGGHTANALVPALQSNTGAGLLTLVGGPVPPDLNNLAPLTATMFVWTYSVSGSGVVTMTATASGSDAITFAAVSDSATIGILTATRANLIGALSFSPASTTQFVGQWFTVSLTVTNTGQLPATGVLPFGQLNSGTTLLTAVAGPVPPGPLTIWGGSATTFTWTFSVNGSGLVSMTATAQGGNGAGAVTSASVTRVEILKKLATLDASLVFVPAGAKPGQLFAVAMIVVNTGDYPATGLAPSLLVTSGAGSATQLLPAIPPNLSTLAAGSATYFYWTWSATAPGAMDFTVSVSGVGAPFPVAIGDLDSGTFYIAQPAILTATLSIAPATATVFVGQWITVTFTVSNSGSQPALGLVPTKVFTPGGGLTLIGGSTSFLGSLPPGSATTFTWTYSVSGAGNLAFTVSAAGDDGTGTPIVTGRTGFALLRLPALLTAVMTVPPGTWVPGNRIGVRLTVSNTGDVPATSVTAFCDVNTGAGLMTVFGGPLPPGPLTLPAHTAVTFTWSFTAQTPGVVVFTATAQGTDSGLLRPLIDEDTGGGTILPSGGLTGWVTATPLIVSQGGLVTVIYSVSNSGSSAIWSVTASANALPSPAALATKLSGPVPAVQPLVNPGETRSFTWTYRANAPGMVLFSATVAGFESVTGLAVPVFAVSNTVTIDPVPLLAGVLTTTAGPFKPGQAVTVWLTVTNAGSATAWVALLPTALTFSPSTLVTGVLGPSPASATLLPGSATTFTWSFLAADGGTVTLGTNITVTYLPSGTTIVASLPLAAVGVAVVILPRPDGDFAVYPNPVRGGLDALTISLRLNDDAREVTVDAYDAAMHRVWGGTWRNVRKLDGTLDVRGLADWAPGVYLLRARAEPDNGGPPQVFPHAKLVVKP